MTTQDLAGDAIVLARKALSAMQIKPLTWDEVMTEASARLSSEDIAVMRKHHRHFVAYPTESTLKKFYGFCYSRGLQDLLASFRFERLVTIISTLDLTLVSGQSLCEVGAGGGYVLRWLLSAKSPRLLTAYDLAPEAQGCWPKPVRIPQDHETFDTVLCLDALGEIHDDPDRLLSEPSTEDMNNLEALLEQRYGFAQKLAAWKPKLSPGGRLVLIEPLNSRSGAQSSTRSGSQTSPSTSPPIWTVLAQTLAEQGWRPQPRSLTSGLPYLELTLTEV
jgi:hypothetical protein